MSAKLGDVEEVSQYVNFGVQYELSQDAAIDTPMFDVVVSCVKEVEDSLEDLWLGVFQRRTAVVVFLARVSTRRSPAGGHHQITLKPPVHNFRRTLDFVQIIILCTRNSCSSQQRMKS